MSYLKTHPAVILILIVVGLTFIAVPAYSQPRTGGVPRAPVVPEGTTALSRFFDRVLKVKRLPSNQGEAQTPESVAPVMPQR